MTTKFKPPFGRKGASHETLNRQRSQLHNDLVGTLLYDAAKSIVVNSDKCDHFYMVHADDFRALASAVRLVEKKLAKDEKMG